MKQYPLQKAHSGELNGHSRIDRNKNHSNKNKNKNESAYWRSIYINDGGYLFDWNVLSVAQRESNATESEPTQFDDVVCDVFPPRKMTLET